MSGPVLTGGLGEISGTRPAPELAAIARCVEPSLAWAVELAEPDDGTALVVARWGRHTAAGWYVARDPDELRRAVHHLAARLRAYVLEDRGWPA